MKQHYSKLILTIKISSTKHSSQSYGYRTEKALTH